MGKKLYRIGELAELAQVSPRTVDYYTQLGLIGPVRRSDANYRFYNDETLARLQRIVAMKREKYSLEEIKESLDKWDKVNGREAVTGKLAELQLHLRQLEKEVKEVGPILERLKPGDLKRVCKMLTPHTAAVIEALLLLLNKSNLL